MASDEEIAEAIYNITSEFDDLPHHSIEACFSPPAELADNETNQDELDSVKEFEGK